MERKSLESAAANCWYLKRSPRDSARPLVHHRGAQQSRVGSLDQIWVFWVAVLVAGAGYLGIARHYNET